jgi:flagella synthesis protein FlgN
MDRLLDRQLEALGRVLEMLGDEHEALLGRDAAALELVTGSKADALARADDLERRRRELAPTLSDMERFAQDPGIGGRWERLLELTRQCRDRNDANGRLIRRQQARVESALGLLRGDSTSGDRDLYGPDGEQRRGNGRAPLASA